MILTPEEKKKRWEAAYAGEIHVPKNLHRATMALFWELRHKCHAKTRGITPVFNMSMRDHDDTLSFPQLYFQCESDYEAAMVILGSWTHWERLCRSEWFAEKLAEWQEEKAERDKAFARAKIKELANNGNLAACKYLAHGGLEEKPTTQKPKKKPAATQEEPKQDTDLDEWLEHGQGLLGEANESGAE